jgi:hypothetical protein
VKTSTNSAPMILRLASGSATPARRPRNCSLASIAIDADVAALGEHFHHLSSFVEAKQAVVDEDARQPVTDRLVDQRRRDARIDAA